MKISFILIFNVKHNRIFLSLSELSHFWSHPLPRRRPLAHCCRQPLPCCRPCTHWFLPPLRSTTHRCSIRRRNRFRSIWRVCQKLFMRTVITMNSFYLLSYYFHMSILNFSLACSTWQDLLRVWVGVWYSLVLLFKHVYLILQLALGVRFELKHVYLILQFAILHYSL